MTIGNTKTKIKTKTKTNQTKSNEQTKEVRNTSTVPCAVKVSIKKAVKNLQGKDPFITSSERSFLP